MDSKIEKRDFIREIVAADVEAGKHGGRVVTRFPPEPNGYLHIGHAKAICLDFEVAQEFDGVCHLRMDDTNPETADPAYVEAIERDVAWLGFEWEGPTRFASDYYERLYRLALWLIEDGRAYVDSLSEEEIREYRGTVTEPGVPSPYRDRSVEENLELFRAMRAGEFDEGAHVLRARIDLAHPNMKMRDPPLYRIRHAPHHRTGDEWHVYPMYDWAHPLSDAIEGITHSFCTLEFEVNRPLYDWAVDNTRPDGPQSEPGSWDPRPRQYEFSRLNLDYTVMSKRKLARLVRDGRVSGWDDPRMPTLAALRRRGVTPQAIRRFIDMAGLSKADQQVELSKLEHATRDDLNYRAPRVMCVLRPLRVVLENYPEDETEWLEAPYYPSDVGKPGSREIPFTRDIYIERDDFREDPPDDFYRLAPGREVRLRYGYFITCTDVLKSDDGTVTELRCTYDPETRGGAAPDGRQMKGTLHWVSAVHALPVEVRLYDRLFDVPDPEAGTEDPAEHLNPDSLEVLEESRIEPSVADDPADTHYQFERQGYFVRDKKAESGTALIFNRTVPLRDTWARREREARSAAQKRKKAAVTAGTSARSDAAGGDAGGDSEAGDGGERRSYDREQLRRENPELAEAYETYQEELGLSRDDADLLTGEPGLAELFDEARAAQENPEPVANWIIHELRPLMGDRSVKDLPFGGAELGRLVALVEDGRITQTVARNLLERMLAEGGDPEEIVQREGLERIADRDALGPLIEKIVAGHPDEAERYRDGQEGLLGFFVGQVMRETDGQADPELVQELVRETLSRGGDWSN